MTSSLRLTVYSVKPSPKSAQKAGNVSFSPNGSWCPQNFTRNVQGAHCLDLLSEARMSDFVTGSAWSDTFNCSKYVCADTYKLTTWSLPVPQINLSDPYWQLATGTFGLGCWLKPKANCFI